jgi:hypothetical protein
MTWPNGTRYKLAIPGTGVGGGWSPSDMNGVQDQILQVAGYRGKSIISTSETRTNAAYGTLTTPDQVAGIVLPADGLLMVAYSAVAKCSVANAARWAIFLNGVQLKHSDGSSTAPVVQEADVNALANGAATFALLGTGPRGAVDGAQSPADYTADVTTGQVAAAGGNAMSGGPVAIKAAAGTYTVDIRFKSTSGIVTVKNRELRVWTEAFA